MQKPIKKDVGNVFSKGATGASVGAAIGSIGTPVGSAIGAGVGFVAGSIIGAIQNQNTFDQQMNMYRMTQKNKKASDQMALASRRESSRQQKRGQSLGSSSPIKYPSLDTSDRQLMAMGNSASYDTYMGGS